MQKFIINTIKGEVEVDGIDMKRLARAREIIPVEIIEELGLFVHRPIENSELWAVSTTRFKGVRVSKSLDTRKKAYQDVMDAINHFGGIEKIIEIGNKRMTWLKENKS